MPTEPAETEGSRRGTLAQKVRCHVADQREPDPYSNGTLGMGYRARAMGHAAACGVLPEDAQLALPEGPAIPQFLGEQPRRPVADPDGLRRERLESSSRAR